MSLIPLVQGGHSVASGFDSTLIGNSVWFDSGDYFSQDSAASDSGRKEAIFSTWLQRSKFGEQGMFMCVNGSSATDYLVLDFQSDDTLRLLAYDVTVLVTTQVFRDIGWYHILVTIDTSQNSNASQKIFVNGEEVTSFSTRNNFGSSADIGWGRNQTHLVNSSPTSVGQNQMIGYMAQTALITDKSFQQGDYSITDFVDAFTIGTNGSQFVPKKNADIATIVGAGGNNSFLLTYENSSDLGNDGSSKNNDFSDNSMGSANQSSNTPSKVYSTWNPIQHPFPTTSGSLVAPTLTEGNLRAAISSGNRGAAISSLTIPAGSGKFAAKFTVNTVGGIYPVIGVYDVEGSNAFTNGFTATSDSVGLRMDGQKYVDGSSTSYGSSVSATNTVEVELDMNNNTVEFLINGSAQGTISKTFSGRVGFMIEDGTSSGAIDVTAEFDFTPNDSNFLTLNSANLTAPTHQGCDAFSAVTYTGNGSTRSITTDIAPAWVWIKNRSQDDEHKLVDVVRGTTKELVIDGSTAEQTDSNGVTALGSSSFSLGSGANGYNDNTENFIAWCWAAGTAFSNDASATGIGTLDSSGRVNASDSLSILSYTGSGANASIKHGLSAAPQMYWVRNRDAGNDWNVYADGTDASPASGSLRLDNGAAFLADPTIWNGVPSSTVINLGTSDETNKLNNAFVAFCFRSVPGVCKVGSYTPNNITNGPYVSLGFTPSFLLIKCVQTTNPWIVFDAARDTANPVTPYLLPNSDAQEASSGRDIDLLADGFKIREDDSDINGGTSNTYLYLAMADIASGSGLAPIYGR